MNQIKIYKVSNGYMVRWLASTSGKSDCVFKSLNDMLEYLRKELA